MIGVIPSRKMNRTFILYIFGLSAVALALAVPSLALLSPFTFGLIFPLAILWLWKSEGHSFWDLGYRIHSQWLRTLAIGLLFGLAIPILFEGIQLLGGWIRLIPKGDPAANLVFFVPDVFLITVLYVAVEEFVFRGFLLQALSQRTGVWSAVVLASLLWGASHLTSMVRVGLNLGSILIGMTTFLFWGIALSLSFIKGEKSLWLPYGLHLGNNLSFNLVGWLFITRPNAPQWWIGHPAWSSVSGLIGVIVWLILAVIIYLFLGNDEINSFTEVIGQPP